MKPDIEIAQKAKIKSIKDIAKKIGLNTKEYSAYGNYMAKVTSSVKDKENNQKAKLVLVTAINPTPYGEGKTTMSIGLVDALNKIGLKTIGVLREPSLGPVFGVKGGAAGGGYSQVIPMENINLHFTGDFHAIESANNLISATLDNHLFNGNDLGLDLNKISFRRCMDMNDRALRNITLTVKDSKHPGFIRDEKFDITAASEMMAILCLSKDIIDLEKRIDRIILGYSNDDKPIFAKELGITGAVIALLKDAINPNLVQTLENNPILIHGGPFANIAHGCNSIIATKLGMELADYVITEAGFGADLGAEKFLDIKCRELEIAPDCVVIVVTTKALKYNGGVNKEAINEANLEDLGKGIKNLQVHVENMQKYGLNVVVCLNKYLTDNSVEIEFIEKYCKNTLKVAFAVSESFANGGAGALNLANEVVEATQKNHKFITLYDINDSLEEKIEKISSEIYRAKKVNYNAETLSKIQMIKASGLDKLPICVAKTQYSISDNPLLLGKPEGHEVNVTDINVFNGAGFITVYMGNMITMPGLPKIPAAMQIKVINDKIQGLF